MPDNHAFRPGNFSASAWFYLVATPSRYKIIVGKNLCAGVLESFAIYINLAGHLSGTISNGTNSAYVEYTSPSLNTWHFTTITYNHDSLKLYLDGKLVNAISTDIQITYDNNSFAIGYQLENCANDYFFHGKIDEVRLYNGALSDQQVSDLYNSTSFAVANENSTATIKNLLSVSVFPNPVSSLLNIYINNVSAASVDAKNELNINAASINLNKTILQLVGIAGNVLISKQVDAFNKQNVLQLNVSQLASGAYFVKIINPDGTVKAVKQVIKE